MPRHTVKAHSRKTRHGTHQVRAHERGPYTFQHAGRNPNKFIETPGNEHAAEFQKLILDALQGAGREGGES